MILKILISLCDKKIRMKGHIRLKTDIFLMCYWTTVWSKFVKDIGCT